MIRTLRLGARSVEYQLICARNRTSFLLQALPEGKIRLYAPAGCPLRRADQLVKDNIARIDGAHRAMDSEFDQLPGRVLYRGQSLAMELMPGAKADVSAGGDVLYVNTPDARAEYVNALVKKWLVSEALRNIRVLLDKWAPTVGRAYGRVTIRDQRSRWGSCSEKGNLNFNWKLIMAPEGAMEYVVIHELCHLIYLNHSERFWSKVRQRMPEYAIWRKWLRDHASELRFP